MVDFFEEALQARRDLARKREAKNRESQQYKLACSMASGNTRLSAVPFKKQEGAYGALKRAEQRKVDKVIERALRILDRDKQRRDRIEVYRPKETMELQLEARIARRGSNQGVTSSCGDSSR